MKFDANRLCFRKHGMTVRMRLIVEGEPEVSEWWREPGSNR